jgi:glucose-6-phosphate 1-dehydrogenase
MSSESIIPKPVVKARPGGPSTGGCVSENRPEPCAVVIFGASGDLTARKLFPSLFQLLESEAMPERFAVIGAARSEMDDEAFRGKMSQALKEHGRFETDVWENMAGRVFYQRLDYYETEDYLALGRRLGELDEELGLEGNRIFYMATPPKVYKTAAEYLGRAELCSEKHGFARIVVEKPFGYDLESARDLDFSIHESFEEHQVFRIDHYLAKETVQNILMFRFANSVFEPVWNRNYIESITVCAAESVGVGHRAGYYDRAGVLRDMFQNHMMQLLAVTSVEPPSVYKANRVRDEKVKVYRSLRPFNPDRLREHLVLGQYGPGQVDGENVPGYRKEQNVDPGSLTPTFAALTCHLDNWRWQGVPFHLVSGKRLKEKLTRIAVHFKQVPHSMFREVIGERIEPNRLVMDIYPDEAISLVFQSKGQGAKLCLRSTTMRFDFAESDPGRPLDAYETVLLDVMLGDHTLFWRQDGVEQTWGYLTPILEICEECGDKAEHLHGYPAGSWGPEKAKDIMRLVI